MSIRSAICRLFGRRCKRAMVIIGAGASVDFGLGATGWFGKEIEARLAANTFCVANGGLDAYLAVRDGLTAFYDGEASEAHFERIYHALHELTELTRPVAAAVPKFRPILQSLVDVKSNYVPTHPNGMGGFRDFEVACDAVIQAIYEIASLASDKPAIPLDSFAAFLRDLRRDHVVRAYTTNYDDFALQAAPDLYTGFTAAGASGTHKRFNEREFWQKWNIDALFHLHGSVHFGWPHVHRSDFTQIGWFPDRKEALRHSTFSGSGLDQMDGSFVRRTSVITGLGKLARLQEVPFNHYYSALAKDALDADVILVLGCGMGDLHVTAWLEQARKAKPMVPLLFVGYWGHDAKADSDFYSAMHFDQEDKEIEMMHKLYIDPRDVTNTGVGASQG